MNRQDVKTIIILLLIFSIIIGTVFVFTSKERKIKRTSEYINFEVLKDESLFLSVSEGINNLFIEINKNNDEEVLNLLSQKYIEKNNLKNDNVINYLENYIEKSFKASTMNVISKNNYYAFLVEGYLINNTFEQTTEIIDTVYFILNYDIVSSNYSIEPISKKAYNNYIKNKNLIPDKNVNKNNLPLKTYNDELLSLYYFNDVIINIYSNPKYVYDRIDETTKSNYFNTYDKFISYVMNNKTFEGVHLIKYNKKESIYKLIDNKNNEYSINVINGLNYIINIKINETEG